MTRLDDGSAELDTRHEELTSTDSFAHLSRYVTKDGNTVVKVSPRVTKASDWYFTEVEGRCALCRSVLTSADLMRDIQYACRRCSSLGCFDQRCLLRIARTEWSERLTNTQIKNPVLVMVLGIFCCHSINISRLRWLSHELCMANTRQTNCALFCLYHTGWNKLCWSQQMTWHSEIRYKRVFRFTVFGVRKTRQSVEWRHWTIWRSAVKGDVYVFTFPRVRVIEISGFVQLDCNPHVGLKVIRIFPVTTLCLLVCAII